MSKKILIAEDSISVLAVTKYFLESQGYTVITAVNGQEVLKKTEKENPDLIILDIIMPEMDGLTTLKKLKKRSKSSKIPLPPVIILTAKEKMKDLFAVEGINDYIVKPAKPQVLLAKIKELLAQ